MNSQLNMSLNAPKIIAKLNFMFNKSSASGLKSSYKLLGYQVVESPLFSWCLLFWNTTTVFFLTVSEPK